MSRRGAWYLNKWRRLRVRLTLNTVESFSAAAACESGRLESPWLTHLLTRLSLLAEWSTILVLRTIMSHTARVGGCIPPRVDTFPAGASGTTCLGACSRNAIVSALQPELTCFPRCNLLRHRFGLPSLAQPTGVCANVMYPPAALPHLQRSVQPAPHMLTALEFSDGH